MNHPIVNRLRELLHQVPFEAFTIRMVDGSTYAVPHEDFLWVTRSDRVMHENPSGGIKTLNVTLISEIVERSAAQN